MSHRSLGISIVVAGMVVCTGLKPAQAQMRMNYGAMRYMQQAYQQQYQQQAAMQKAMMEEQQKQAAADAAEEKRLHDKKVSASRSRVEKEKAKKEEIIAKRKADAAAKTAVLTSAPGASKRAAGTPATTDKPNGTKN